jgi:hypothetical protein
VFEILLHEFLAIRRRTVSFILSAFEQFGFGLHSGTRPETTPTAPRGWTSELFVPRTSVSATTCVPAQMLSVCWDIWRNFYHSPAVWTSRKSSQISEVMPEFLIAAPPGVCTNGHA